jgi:hypothetical protein
VKNVYLSLAIVGTVVPYVFFLEHFGSAGLAIGTFLAAAFANGAAGGATADLVISSLVFWVFLASRKTPQLWLYVLVNLLIGLSCALPLYLYRHASSAVPGAAAR